MPVPPKAIDGVDLYVGGAEHAVLHLLYARFWHKVLFDLGCVSTPEPFGKLFNQGMIRSFAYRDSRGIYLGYDKVDTSGEDGKPRHKETGEELVETVEKMSKSLKNVVNPDEVIGQYGADTFRLYEMFMGPLEASKPWNTRDVPGVHRFLNRVWRMICGSEDHASLVEKISADYADSADEKEKARRSADYADGADEKEKTESNLRKSAKSADGSSDDLERALHRLIKKAGEDIRAMKFNTAIAAMMEFVNAAHKAGSVAPSQARRFVLVLAPFAPHIAEELWQILYDGSNGDRHGQTTPEPVPSLAYEPWPAYDESLIAEATVELPVQINGKMRGKVNVAADADDQTVLAAAMAEPKVAAALQGKTIVKQFVVKGRLVNIVVR
jgi:leucyl-tRNA synthetase